MIFCPTMDQFTSERMPTMRRLPALMLAGMLATSGCGSHGQVIRTEAPPRDDEPKAERVNNAESRTVQNWSGSDN